MNARTSPEDLAIDAATPVRRDYLWLELTSAGNRAFGEGASDAARRLYTRALQEADRLFDTGNADNISVPLPAILNISCHNLAELAARNGEQAECTRLLVHAFDRLAATARRPTAGLELRTACVQHLKYALLELAAHLTRLGDPALPPQHFIDRARKAASAVRHASEHARRADGDACGHCRLPH